jgi:hypothetical protein
MLIDGQFSTPKEGNTMSLRLTLLLTLFVFVSSLALGQNDRQVSMLIKTAAGVLWTHNEDGAHFIFEIKGDEIQQLQGGGPMLRVGNRPLQMSLVRIEEFLSVKEPRPKDVVILKAHQDWEAAYHSKLINTKLTLRSETIRLGDDREALFWDYPNPPHMMMDFKAQSFLTTVIGKHLLVLNAPAHTSEPINAARDFLVAILSTLQVSPAPIDIKALVESIIKADGKVPALSQSDKKGKP